MDLDPFFSRYSIYLPVVDSLTHPYAPSGVIQQRVLLRNTQLLGHHWPQVVLSIKEHSFVTGPLISALDMGMSCALSFGLFSLPLLTLIIYFQTFEQLSEVL